MPPGLLGFGLTLINSKSTLDISLGSQLGTVAVDPISVFSAHIEKRTITDYKGRQIGEADWGNLNTGERWRNVRFGGRVVAKYGFINEKNAEVFDQVINSVCLLPAPG
jgi:hypothetical protein